MVMIRLSIPTEVPNRNIGVAQLVRTVLEIALRPLTEKAISRAHRTAMMRKAGCQGRMMITAVLTT